MKKVTERSPFLLCVLLLKEITFLLIFFDLCVKFLNFARSFMKLSVSSKWRLKLNVFAFLLYNKGNSNRIGYYPFYLI